MRFMAFAAAGVLALVACAASGQDDERDLAPDDTQGDGGPPLASADPVGDGGGQIDLDAERPLSCSDAGLCETRLPVSRLGLPFSLRGVWVVASNDVWSISADGYILHYDGASWSTSYVCDHALHAVWATATSVWAAGESGLLLHRTSDGTWSAVESGHTSSIKAIAGTGDSDVWFTSHDGTVDHFDGSALTNHPLDVPGLTTTTVFGRAGLGVLAAGYVKETPDSSTEPQYRSYVFELTPAGPTSITPGFGDEKMFIPTSGAVTDAPNAAQRVFLAGSTEVGGYLVPAYAIRGADGWSIHLIDVYSAQADSERRRLPVPIIAYGWNDIYMPIGFALSVWFDGAIWHGAAMPSMGKRFAPGLIFGTHGDESNMWIVGDGFALKGPRP
jgi:hypothetical protein